MYKFCFNQVQKIILDGFMILCKCEVSNLTKMWRFMLDISGH